MFTFPEVEQVLDWYEAIWINDTNCENDKLAPEQRLEYHKNNSLPMMEKIKQWCIDYLQSSASEQHSALGKACTYFVDHYDELAKFCKVAQVPIDNNKAEEGLKVPIRTRKSAHFYKTKNGAEVSNRLTSLICTAHRNGVNAFHYLNALQRNKDQVKKDPTQWLPWTISDQYLSG